jgi:hypothetical protein
MLRVSEYISKTLANLGVRHVFMLTGGGAKFLNVALGTNPKIKPIFNHHEQDCTIAAQVKISRDGRGRARDNIFTKRQWRNLKYEEVYLHEYASPKEASRGLSQYIYFCDYQRPHQALDYQAPAHIYGVSLPVVNSTCQVEPVKTLTNQYTLN